MNKLYETVTIRRPLSGSLNDLAQFVLWLEKSNKITRTASFKDKNLVEAVREFYEIVHGEED